MLKSYCRLLTLAAVLASGCAQHGDEAPVVARVGDALLTVAELENQVPDAEMAEEQRRLFVDGWVRQQLFYAEAIAQELHESPRVQRLLAQAQRDLVVAAFLDGEFGDEQIDIADIDIENYYYLHTDEYTRSEDEVRAQHILIGSRRDANTLRQELLRGGDFEERARELSIDRETLGAGGDLGYFGAAERPDLWEACVNLSLGQISRTVSTERGYHIVRLVDRKEAGSARSLDEPEVRDQIVEALVRERHRERIDSLFNELKGKHNWQIDETQLSAP